MSETKQLGFLRVKQRLSEDVPRRSSIPNLRQEYECFIGCVKEGTSKNKTKKS